MKKFISFTVVLALVTSISQAQGTLSAPGGMAPEGTSLGANDTIAYNGIALGNRVKMRGFVDFTYTYGEMEGLDDKRFSTESDVDFLFDFSPVTGEAHIAFNPNPSAGVDQVTLEQAFARYSFNQDFNLSFGRQLTNLGYDGDERTDLKTVSTAYMNDALIEHPAFASVSGAFMKMRRNYKDGLRANFNNGMFGLSFGVHDGYFTSDDFNDNVAIDLAASVMIVPGLEARIGYAHQEVADDAYQMFNTWIEYNPGDLTLALEFDYMEDIFDTEGWDLMLMGNYQFIDWFGLTFRYSHESFDYTKLVLPDYDTNRFTLALLFGVTSYLDVKFEYSYTDVDYEGLGSMDVNEVYLQTLLRF